MLSWVVQLQLQLCRSLTSISGCSRSPAVGVIFQPVEPAHTNVINSLVANGIEVHNVKSA